MDIIWFKNNLRDNALFMSKSPELRFDIGYVYERQGANVVYTPTVKLWNRNGSSSGMYAGAYADVTINGQTQTITIASSLPSSNYSVIYEKTGSPVTVAATSGTVPMTVRFYTADNDPNGLRQLTATQSMEVPEPTSTITLMNDDPIRGVVRLTNLSSYSASIKVGDQYLQSNGSWSSTEAKLPSGDYNLTYRSDFTSPTSLSKEVRFVVTTYNGSTNIGYLNYDLIFNLKEVDAKPVCAYLVKDVNGTTTALTGDENKFILNASRLSASGSASLKYGATLTYFKVGYEGSTKYDVPHDFSNVSSNKIIYYIKDSRGKEYSYTVNLNSINYNPPTITALVERMGSEDAIKINVRGTWNNTNFGSVANTFRLRYKAREVGGTYPTNWTTISYTPTSSNWNLSGPIDGFDYTKEYEIIFNVYDKLRNTSTNDIYIPKSIPIADWGKEDFHFHVPVIISTESNQPITINGIDLWDWMQKVEKKLWPEPEPEPDVPTEPTVYTNVSVPTGSSWSQTYDFKPTKVIASSRSYPNQEYTVNTNKVCGVNNFSLTFTDNGITFNNTSGMNATLIEIKVYFV